MKIYGLIGSPLSHSFSKQYFTTKFEKEGFRDCRYELFPLQLARDVIPLLHSNPEIHGLNVTIPFKKTIIKYLDELSKDAEEIGAVNCIKLIRSGSTFKLKGFNTDAVGFEQAIKPLLKPQHKKALILGTGGSALAVAFIFNKLGIDYLFVSRNPHDCNQVGFGFITDQIIGEYPIIVNATPIGMSPDDTSFPQIPYDWLTEEHLLFDLVYNPESTVFMKKGQASGAIVSNGLKMLYMQADAAWEIWNS